MSASPWLSLSTGTSMLARPLMIVAALTFTPAVRLTAPVEVAAPRPNARWQYSAQAWGTPAIDANRVYVMTRDG